MRLEDIDYIFEADGITGGVLSKRGRLIDRRRDIESTRHHNAELKGSETELGSPAAFEIHERAEKHA